MSNVDPNDDDVPENPEPEADSTVEPDDQLEPESESNIEVGAVAANHSSNNNSENRAGICANNESVINSSNAQAAPEQSDGGRPAVFVEDQQQESGEQDVQHNDLVQVEDQADFAAEDEQCFQKNVAEVDFTGAEWSLEPEENSHAYQRDNAERGITEADSISYGAESDQYVSHLSDRTESSGQDVGNVPVETAKDKIDTNVENSNGNLCDNDTESNEAEGCDESPEDDVNTMNNMAEEDNDLSGVKEFEIAEEDQGLQNPCAGLSNSQGDEAVEGNSDSTVGPENDSNASGVGDADDSIAGSVDDLTEASTERKGSFNVEDSQVVEKCVPDDEIGALSSGEPKMDDMSESYQPECDQSAVENSQCESSPIRDENSSEHDNLASNAEIENGSKSESHADGEIQTNECKQECESIVKSESSDHSDAGEPAMAENTIDDRLKIDSKNDPQSNETNPNHSNITMAEDMGAIPKRRNHLSDHDSPESSGSNESLTNSVHINPQINGRVESDDCLEDELLSELDATLQNSEKAGSKDSVHLQGSIDHGDISKSCEQCFRNNLQCSFIQAKRDNVNIPEVKELKRQLRQAKQLLLDRECAISSLKEDLEDQRCRSESLVLERDSCQKELECLKYQNTEDLYIPQIKELEYTITQQQNEIRGLKDKLSSHDSAAKRAISTLQQEMKLRIDQVSRQYEDATKEKDAMVVKYAQAEHKNLEYLKQAERAENKLHDMEKERDAFLLRMRSVKEQRSRLGAEVEAKNSEINGLNKELDKYRELVSSSEVRIKWAQNKLKVELDAHKETKVQLEKMTVKLKEAKEETQQIRQDCQAIIKTYQESEEVKSNSLDKELKQKETELLANQQQKTNFELAHVKTQRELERVKVELEESKSRHNALKEKLSVMDGEAALKEANLNKFAETIQRQKKEIQELRERIETLVQYRTDFNRSQDLIKSLDAEISELKISNKDLVSEMDACRKREMDKLELTEKLSLKNADLQSDNTSLSNKVLDLTGKLETLKIEYQGTDTKLKDTSSDFAKQQKLHQEEIQSLNTKYAGKCKAVEDLMRKVEEEKDEIKTLKRKHANNVKDLTRQLQQVRRKLEGYEVNSNSTNGDKDTTSMGSRTSSNGSLNTVNIADQTSTQIVQPGSQGHTANSNMKANPSQEQEYPVITEQVEVDKQVLIERIVKLQRAHARKNEKLEFMDDHITQLVDEIQKKNRIIQSYVLKEETGALTSDSGDRMKQVDESVSQAEMSRKHSIMGSVYSSHPTDGTMTLDLSLEINRKLQAVLEDTLLKNMTLKESLDTLGKEIARLSQENRSLQIQMQSKGRSKGTAARR